MKKILVAIAFVTAMVSSAMAIEGGPSMTASTMVKTRYLAGNNGYFSEGPVLQSDLFTVFGNGVWVDLWNSQGLSDESASSFADEIDLGIGWAGKLGQSGLALDTGVYYFDCRETLHLDEGDLAQVYVELTPAEAIVLPLPVSTKTTVTPFVRVETLRDTGNGDVVNFESTIFVGDKVNTAFTDKVSLSSTIKVYYDPGIFGVEPGIFVSYEGSLNVQLSKSTTLKPIWFKAVDETSSGEINTVAGTGLAISF